MHLSPSSLPSKCPSTPSYCYVCCGSVFFSEDAKFVKTGKKMSKYDFSVLKHSEQISVGTDDDVY